MSDDMNTQLVLIAGESTTGKSFSLMNIPNQSDWMYLGTEAGKRLPFKNDFATINVSDPYEVHDAFLLHANQRSRKWMTNPDGECSINEEGELLDALNFIPRTTKNENYKAEYIKVQSLDNLERWFAQRMATGNRNNQILKYAMALVDNGMDLHSIQQHVHAFNKKLPNSLSADELDNTVLRSVARKFI